MNYNNVIIVNRVSTATAPSLYILEIDGAIWIYHSGFCRTAFLKQGNAGQLYDGPAYVLNVDLPMNEDNPRLTLDRFFKLLLLQ